MRVFCNDLSNQTGSNTRRDESLDGGGGGGCSYIKRMGVLIVTFRGFGKRVLPQKLELLQYLLIGVLSKKKLF